MSDTEQAPVIDTGAEITVPDGEVSREDLIKIIEQGNVASADAAEAEEPKPAEPPKDPAKERVSARIIASRKAELRAAAERQAIAKERAETEALKGTVAEQAKMAEALKAAKLSPSKALELLGMTPKEFLESLAGEHEPEAVAKRAVSAEQGEREKLAAEVKQLREQLEGRERAAQQEAARREHHAIQEGFLTYVAENAALYPTATSTLTEREFGERAWQIATKHTAAYIERHGKPPSDDVIAAEVERQRVEELAATHTRFRKPVQPPSQGASANQGQPATANTPRTLTNGTSSQKASAPKPWNQADADAESRRLVEAMLRPAIDS